MGHARTLRKLADDTKIEEYAKKTLQENLSVRDLEDLVSTPNVAKKVPITRKPKINDYSYIENNLRELLGTKVKINDRKVEIYFDSSNDLNRILEILNIKIN